MPIYEYECGACGERQEFIQKFSDPQKRKCPLCGALRLKRLVSAAAFHLKGDGWYVTDFRDKDKKKKKKEDGKSDGKSDAKSDSKSGSDSGKSSGSKSGDSAKKASDSKSAS